ncbi:hypothetical protein AMECASPLE_009845 [Ameca splendens]|uniref:Uncharacterized protein n=1 Tax=Ameca splendens TaxID=208324 RepID=A0ABV0ZLX2_9TELE
MLKEVCTHRSSVLFAAADDLGAKSRCVSPHLSPTILGHPQGISRKRGNMCILLPGLALHPSLLHCDVHLSLQRKLSRRHPG